MYSTPHEAESIRTPEDQLRYGVASCLPTRKFDGLMERWLALPMYNDNSVVVIYTRESIITYSTVLGGYTIYL